jgi:LysR family hydrogen peroxide-inducible transcriptional activator
LFDDRLFVAFPEGEIEPPPSAIHPDQIDETRLLLLEDGHCLKDHALAACNRPELRAEATMLGTSLHTMVQMVDNGLGVTMLPEMAVRAGILEHTRVTARPLQAEHAERQIALVWRKASPRERDFRLLADVLAKAN